MSLAWLFAGALVALFALVVPIALHLTRRLEMQRRDFAALRWLRERLRPRRRLRLRELPLLLLRLALLALCALLLAQPVLRGRLDDADHRVLVIPGVDLAQARAAVSAPTARWQWLAPGWPVFDPDQSAPALPAEASTTIASLLRDADAQSADAARIDVIVPRTLAWRDGARVRARHAIGWHVVDAAPAREIEASPRPPPAVAVRHAPASAAAVRFVQAAVAAWQHDGEYAATVDVQPIGAPLPDVSVRVLWLGAPRDATLDAWIARGGTALVDNARRGDEPVIARRDDGSPLVCAVVRGRGRLVLLAPAWQTRTLPELLDADFAQRLRGWLDPAPVPAAADAEAVAPTRAEAVPAAPPQRSLAAWLALAIASLFLVERWWAGSPRRGAAS